MLPEARSQHQASVPLEGPRFDLHILEFATSAMARGLDSFGNLNSAILFAATARACGPFDQSPGRKRPVSINALAASLGRPFETTRRHANTLIEEGLVTRAPDGLSVTIQSIVEPRVARLIDNCHDLLVRLVQDLSAAGFALPTVRSDLVYDPRSGIGIALDLLLAAVESHGRREENFTRLALLLAVEWAYRRFAGRSEGGREPLIRTSTASRMLGLPYATTSRNIDALVARGLLARAGAGLRPVGDTPLAIEGRAALANRTRLLIGRLAQTGFPMCRPSSAYIHERSPLPDLS